MNISKPKNFRRLVSGILSTLFIMAIPATSALGLPTGYREDFNGCSQEEDKDRRKTCCESVAADCHKVCGSMIGNEKLGPGKFIICGWECDDVLSSCTEGDKIERGIDWPGQPGIQIPGLYTDHNRIVPAKGRDLSISTRSTVIEIHRNKTKQKVFACVAVVATCTCPLKGLEYDTLGKECRPVVDSGVAECRICSTGKSSETCEPCDDCVPEILSVQSCVDAGRSRD